MAQRDADARHKLPRAERLGDIIVCAAFQRPDDAGFIGAAGKDDDRQLQRLQTPTLEQIVAGHIRKTKVEQDQVGLILLHEPQRFPRVRGLDQLVAFGGKADPQQLADGRLIIDNQDLDGGLGH